MSNTQKKKEEPNILIIILVIITVIVGVASGLVYVVGTVIAIAFIIYGIMKTLLKE
jgi:flagellar basal body-associated protein FliL